MLTVSTTILMATSVFLGSAKFAWQKLQICLFASTVMLLSIPLLRKPCTWQPLVIVKVRQQAARLAPALCAPARLTCVWWSGGWWYGGT